MDRLTGTRLHGAGLVLHPHTASQHDRVLVELRPLTGLLPTRRASHVGQAHRLLAVAGAPDVFVDGLRRFAGGGDTNGAFDQPRHGGGRYRSAARQPLWGHERTLYGRWCPQSGERIWRGGGGGRCRRDDGSGGRLGGEGVQGAQGCAGRARVAHTVRARAYAPGRVNVIGDHTDYTGGLVLPMAIQLGTTVEVERGGAQVILRSEHEREAAVLPLDLPDPAGVDPPWARYVAGVVAEMRPPEGASGNVSSDLPVGAGLSSSAALEVAVALALGFAGGALALAQLCQRAERRASGVPCGIMDQLTSVAGVEDALLLIDCRSLDVTPTPLPAGAGVVGIHSGQARALAGSAYAERRAACEAAEREIGPLRDATREDVEGIADPLIRRRARHVVSENERVANFVLALATGDLRTAGQLMVESHASLRDDYEVSTPALDALVERLCATPGVFGARLSGAGFGGVAVALCEPDAPLEGWRFRPSAGATLTLEDSA